MAPTEAMARLDALVAEQSPDNRYAAAKALYEASLAGLLSVRLSPTFLYGWVLKWATRPEARGTLELDLA